ncbi:MAG TPA: glutamine amidotransferase, partial [Acidimicrobiales bacterium]
LGYLGSTTKPTAQTHLEVGEEGDPLLASWQVGLGRATAWTSDASDRWSQAWSTWDGYTSFWAGVVKDTFPLGGSAGAGARAELVDGRLRITAESADGWPDGATAVARVAGPDLQGREVALERTSDNTFVAEVAATAAGTYAVGVSVTGPGGETLLSATTTAVQSYSAEYAVGSVDADALARVSSLAGGRGFIEPAAAFDGEGLTVGHGRVALAGWMLLAAALLWPIAVALGRVALHGSGVAALQAGRRRLVDEVKSRLPARPGVERPPKPVRAPKKAAPPPAAPVPPPTIDRLLKRKRGESTEEDAAS